MNRSLPVVPVVGGAMGQRRQMVAAAGAGVGGAQRRRSSAAVGRGSNGGGGGWDQVLGAHTEKYIRWRCRFVFGQGKLHWGQIMKE